MYISGVAVINYLIYKKEQSERMTKRNKRRSEAKTLPIIKKCNCGETAVEGSIGCIRYPECCDEDLEFI
jgi:hypothetical protein